jgi:hypothetical protein
MKAIRMVTYVACAGLLLTSCKKDDDNATPNGAQLNSFFESNVNSNMQTFTVNASTGGSVVGNKGTRIYIYPGSLTDMSGNPVSGNVTVQLVEIFDRASMVMMNKPTNGKLPNGNTSTLISGGEYFLKITQNGTELSTSTGVLVSIPTDNTGGVDLNMSLFDGAMELGNFWWNQVEDSVPVMQDSIGGTWTTTYQILDGNWGWTNVDRFYDDPRPKTTIKVRLPEGYDNTNSEVYVTYDGEPTALASMDIFTEDGYFSEHYGLIPIGLEVHFIVVTMIDEQLHYAIQGATITDGHVQNITSFAAISQSELALLINALP